MYKLCRLRKKGFTLIEMLITISILMVILGLAALNLTSFGKGTSVEGSRTQVKEALRQAESNSISNLSDTAWAVHLEANRVVIFNGAAFNLNDSYNQVKILPSGANLSWNLAGGGSDIFFDKSKTSTIDTGTININSGNAIKINSEGMIE